MRNSVSEIVVFYGDNYVVNISMEEWADYITIYNKYLSNESIFTSDDIGEKNLYTLSSRESITDTRKLLLFKLSK